MKSTGIIRKVDELGRVVIPIEIRNKFDIAEKDPMWNSYTDINELPPHYIREVSNFFEVYKLLEDGETYVNGSLNKDGAIKIIKEAILRYKEHFNK